MTTMASSVPLAGPFPFGVEVDGPAPQNRLSVLLRILFVIPHLIVVAILGIVAYVIHFISWFAILFTGSYPAGMLNFQVNLLHWLTRMNGYMFLLTDKYPPFTMGSDGAYPIRFTGMGQVEGRNRLTTFWPIRAIMAIPHIIVLYILNIVAQILALIAWIVALITGSVPVGMHNFMAGYVRWQSRAYAYLLNLTDTYPPFSMN